MDLRRADKKFLARESDAEDIQVVRTKGSFLFDARGRKYIDFTAGWCVGNRGWGDEELRGRSRRPRAVDYVYPEYLYRPWVELAALLARIAPGKLEKSFRATGGAEAGGIAPEGAVGATRRGKVISLEGLDYWKLIG